MDFVLVQNNIKRAVNSAQETSTKRVRDALIADGIAGEIENTDAPVASGPIQHTPETVRALMLAILETAREAETMPFTPRELQSHIGLCPYMAEWLEEGGEGKRLLAEFRIEVERLQAKEDINA